ncbi:MAG TPA: hypothetical protein VHU40_10010 [Polyangia bacterium]|jgi:hypothetical protein|nr:hypothetical protein [Polyangia bacterium]
MFGSVALDVAIGLVFCYASISIISSSIYEAIASLSKLRARSLLQGVKAMVNDDAFSGLAHELYQHALVNPRSDGKTQKTKRPDFIPSYIEPCSFAQAFVDVLQKTPDGFASVKARIEALPDAQLKTMLLGMYARAEGQTERFQTELARWFDSGMDRVSGGYKRQAQLCTFLIAFALAGVFNVDTFHLFTTLWQHPAAAAAVAAHAPASFGSQDAMAALSLQPVGWDPMPGSLPRAVAGWFVTAFSVLFGGPFWFDLLQRLVNLRGTGAKPEPMSSPRRRGLGRAKGAGRSPTALY